MKNARKFDVSCIFFYFFTFVKEFIVRFALRVDVLDG